MNVFEKAFGFKLGDPRISQGLKFILKNWDHEKESYSEWYERTFNNQPDRLRRVDTSNSEAIVGSANIDEIAEANRNDLPSQEIVK
jgi:hypothetical protein